MKMHNGILVVGLVCLAGMGGISADRISSTIATDEAAWISSAVVGDQSYSGALFMTEPSSMVRDLDLSDDLKSLTLVNSSGPLGVYEFSSREWKGTPPGLLCLFTPQESDPARHDEISTLGLWKRGIYLSLRQTGSGRTLAATEINASGMVSLDKRTEDANRTQRERSFIAGQMNLSELVEYGRGP